MTKVKNVFLGIAFVIVISTILFGCPFLIDKAFEATHRKEIYKSLECLEEYEFSEETEKEFKDLIEKVANDDQYSILIEYQPNGVAVSVRRSGDYGCNYTKYFYEP